MTILKSTTLNLLGPESPISSKSPPISLPWHLGPTEPPSDVEETVFPNPKPTHVLIHVWGDVLTVSDLCH